MRAVIVLRYFEDLSEARPRTRWACPSGRSRARPPEDWSGCARSSRSPSPRGACHDPARGPAPRGPGRPRRPGRRRGAGPVRTGQRRDRRQPAPPAGRGSRRRRDPGCGGHSRPAGDQPRRPAAAADPAHTGQVAPLPTDPLCGGRCGRGRRVAGSPGTLPWSEPSPTRSPGWERAVRPGPHPQTGGPLLGPVSGPGDAQRGPQGRLRPTRSGSRPALRSSTSSPWPHPTPSCSAKGRRGRPTGRPRPAQRAPGQLSDGVQISPDGTVSRTWQPLRLTDGLGTAQPAAPLTLNRVQVAGYDGPVTLTRAPSHRRPPA